MSCYAEYKDLNNKIKVARWIYDNKVGIYGTTKDLARQYAVEAIAGYLFYVKRKFNTPAEWAEYVSKQADDTIDVIIRNDLFIIPLKDMVWER